MMKEMVSEQPAKEAVIHIGWYVFIKKNIIKWIQFLSLGLLN